jgi:hypothetical protein
MVVVDHCFGIEVSVVERPLLGVPFNCWLASDGSQVVTASTDEASGFKGFRLVNKLAGEVKEVRLSGYTWLLDVDCSARAGLILAVTNTSEKFQIRVFKPEMGGDRPLEDGPLDYFPRTVLRNALAVCFHCSFRLVARRKIRVCDPGRSRRC